MAGDILDALIVGAGVSGISPAARLKRLCPGHCFAALENGVLLFETRQTEAA